MKVFNQSINNQLSKGCRLLRSRVYFDIASMFLRAENQLTLLEGRLLHYIMCRYGMSSNRYSAKFIGGSSPEWVVLLFESITTCCVLLSARADSRPRRVTDTSITSCSQALSFLWDGSSPECIQYCVPIIIVLNIEYLSLPNHNPGLITFNEILAV